MNIRSLSKLAFVRKVQGSTERKTFVTPLVHEDLSTVLTQKLSTEVEFRKRSIELTLNSLSLMVSLGWGDEEREIPQKVLIDLSLRFPKLPKGCKTDELQDTFCYATLTKNLSHFCAQRSFKLIEHLGYELYGFLKKELGDLPLSLSVTKFPPTKNLDRCCFTLRDE